MSTAFKGVVLGLIAMAAAATLLLPAPGTAQTPERRPMTVEDVRRMVEQGVRPQTILTALRQNCLAVYGLDQEMQQELLAAGAEEELLEGLRNVCWGAPGGPVMDPTQPFVVVTEPDAWAAESPQPLVARTGNTVRVQGVAHAPSGVRQLTVNGEPVELPSDQDGGVRFSTNVRVSPGMSSVAIVLQPREGEAYRKTLPIRVGAAGAASDAGVRRPYNPGTVALSGIVPGLAQFRTDNAVLGAIVLGGAGAGIVAALSTRTNVRCGADVGEDEDCPPSLVLSEETERPLLIPGIAAAAGVTVLGAVLGYTAAKAANERAARSGQVEQASTGVRLGQALIERLPTPAASGGWTVELARFDF